MVGYWHNFDNGSGFIRLRDVSPKFDVVNVAFAEPAAGATNGTIGFTPYNYTEADFKADVAYLQSQGKKVLISIGGANGQVQLASAQARDNFVASVTAIIEKYGFDGLDVDFEGHSLYLNAGDTDFKYPTTPVVVNLISALRAINDHFGTESFYLTMAPETFFVQLGYSFYGELHQLRQPCGCLFAGH
ncbi:glycosyl hydrolase family 18 protein [Paenibacillus sp. JTLBN-2024]